MKKTLLFICTLLPFFAFAQCHSSVSVFGGVDYDYRLIPNSVFEEGATGMLRETAQVKSRFGVNFHNRVNEKLYFKTGLRVANIGYNQLVREQQYDAGQHRIISYTKEIDNLYLEVPFMFGLTIGHDRVSAFVELGVSPHIFLNANHVDSSDKYWDRLNDQTLDYFNFLTLSGNMSVGLDFLVTDNVSTFIAPTARYHFTSSSLEIEGEQLLSFGVEFGVRKRIND